MAPRFPTVEVTETYKVPDFSGRIKKGVALLDKKAPGWADKVDLKALDLGDTDHCIVGQLAIKAMLNGPLEGFYEGITKLWPNRDHTAQARLHGFCLDDKDYEAVEKMLRKEPSYHPWKLNGAEDTGFGYRDDYISGVLYEFLGHQWFQVVQARQAATKRAARRVAVKKATKKAVTKKTTAKKTAAKKAAARKAVK